MIVLRIETFAKKWTPCIMDTSLLFHHLQLISGALEHSVLCAWEVYALENTVFYIAVYGPYKP